VCAIIGIYGESFVESGGILTMAMADSMVHRGPDDSGIYQDRSNALFLGHNRLSIIDLSERGHQPMCNEKNGDVLVFNGEIYNFRELRENLKGKGYYFKSDSDTEVLLHCFEEWGIDCLSRVKGMFAFLLWSAASRTLHVVRDPMGIKPLYYWRSRQDGGVAFASEVKAFRRLPEFEDEIDRESLIQFLEFGYSFDQSRTIFKNVSKLPPGHRIEVCEGRMGKPQRYFWPILKHRPDLDREEIEAKLFTALSTVVSEHMAADVSVGLLLSGGLDSSILAALAARKGPIHTYSMGFSQSNLDERSHARLVSEYIGSHHEEILIGPDELLTDLQEAAGYFDDLFADWGMVSTRLLYKKCREKGNKVVIVGEGSDELFGGYDIFRHALVENNHKFTEWRLIQLYRAYAGRRYGSQYFAFRAKMKEYLDLTEGDFFDAIRLFESRDQLPNNYVMKVDKASMAVSVEARVPFLDSRIAEIAYQIPGEMLINKGHEKILLRSMAKAHGLLPEEIIDRPKFGASIAASWMTESSTFRSYAKDVIFDSGGWVDELGLRDAMTDYFVKGRSGYSFPRAVSIFRNLAWRLLLLNLWSRFYLNTPPNNA